MQPRVVAVDDLRSARETSATLGDALAVSPRIAPPREPIPGWRIAGSLWPNERFIIRVPRHWNGKLVVAGTPAQRSEHVNDLIWSDPVLARGFAYACGNKSLGDGMAVLTGDERLVVDGVTMPRFVAPGGMTVAFWQHAPNNRLERWMEEFFALTRLAQEIVADLHGRAPDPIYAVGLSNGGVQVRYALERSDLYAGGLVWNGVLWTVEHNLLRHMPQAVEAMEAGMPERLAELGFPADVRGESGASLYERNFGIYWIASAWIYAMLFDPQTSIPYGDVRDPAPAEAWNGRIGSWRIERTPEIEARIGAYANTGDLRAKMIDLASEYDHLIPPAMHFHPYAGMVAASGKSDRYRAALIPNAQHVEAWSEDPDFPTLHPGYPQAMRAFDELVGWVES